MIKKKWTFLFLDFPGSPSRRRLSLPAFFLDGDAGDRYSFHQPHRKRDGGPVGNREPF